VKIANKRLSHYLNVKPGKKKTHNKAHMNSLAEPDN